MPRGPGQYFSIRMLVIIDVSCSPSVFINRWQSFRGSAGVCYWSSYDWDYQAEFWHRRPSTSAILQPAPVPRCPLVSQAAFPRDTWPGVGGRGGWSGNRGNTDMVKHKHTGPLLWQCYYNWLCECCPSTLHSTPLSEINSNIEVNWKALTGSVKELVNNW